MPVDCSWLAVLISAITPPTRCTCDTAALMVAPLLPTSSKQQNLTDETGLDAPAWNRRASDDYRCLNRAGRFSVKALTPSARSSVA